MIPLEFLTATVPSDITYLVMADPPFLMNPYKAVGRGFWIMIAGWSIGLWSVNLPNEKILL